MKKTVKEYNARGERMYENQINRENAKTEKINKNKMKNTEISKSECVKAEVLYRRIMWRLNLLAEQIHESKKGFTCFYAIVQKKQNVLVGEKNEKDISWVEVFDDFTENWEEMENVKDEVDWMIRDIFFVVEREEDERKKKTEKDMH